MCTLMYYTTWDVSSVQVQLFSRAIPKWDWTDFHYCWKPLCSLYAVSSEQPVCCSSKRGEYDKVLLDAFSQVGCQKKTCLTFIDLNHSLQEVLMVEKHGYVRSIWEHSSSFLFGYCESFCSRILLELMCFSLPLCLSLYPPVFQSLLLASSLSACQDGKSHLDLSRRSPWRRHSCRSRI